MNTDNSNQNMSFGERMAALKKQRAKNKRITDAFDAMTDQQKRTAIASDVLKQVNDEYLIPIRRMFADTFDGYGLFKDHRTDKSIADAIDQAGGCKACAIGSMVICAMRRFRRDISNASGSKMLNLSKLFAEDILSKYFSKNQIALIENAYEDGQGAYGSVEMEAQLLGQEQYHSAVAFLRAQDSKPSFKKYITDDDYTRMRLIMENIIANDGTFCPEVLPQMDPKIPGQWMTPGFSKDQMIDLDAL